MTTPTMATMAFYSTNIYNAVPRECISAFYFVVVILSVDQNNINDDDGNDYADGNDI